MFHPRCPRALLAAAISAFLASCATEPPPPAPSVISLDEAIAHATAIYYCRLDRRAGESRRIVEAVWRNDDDVSAAPAIGSEVNPERRQRDAGTRQPDHVVVFTFEPRVPLPNGRGLAEMDALEYDGYVHPWAVTPTHLKDLIAKSAWRPSAPLTLQSIDSGETDEHPRAFAGAARPRLIKSVPPVYPRKMRERGITGEVVLDLLVGTDGAVDDVRVIRATDSSFASAAAACVLHWRYEPALKNGRPVARRLQVPIVFTLSSE